MGGAAGRLSLLVDDVARSIERHAMLRQSDRVLVAVSGGPDSVALLHILVILASSRSLILSVGHVDHGLRLDSATDAEFVRALAARYGLRADVVRLSLPVGCDEATARRARYAALDALAARCGADRIALGHTADDQAETVLMRLQDAAGVRGLAGMPAVRGRLIRPLLAVRRAEILGALTDAALAWREDPTNTDVRFRRNAIRHRVLPSLCALAGRDVVPTLLAIAGTARAAVSAIEEGARRELDRLARVEGEALSLSRADLAALPPTVAVDVLRQALARVAGGVPLRAWGHRALARALAVPAPRRACRVGGAFIEVSGDAIRLGTVAVPALACYGLEVPGRVALDARGEAIEARVVPRAGYRVSPDPRVAAFDAEGVRGPLLVRARRAGDRFQPFGGREQRLKSFLIDAKVPRWERARLPVVEADGQIVWLAGVRRGALAPVVAETRQVVELRLMTLA